MSITDYSSAVSDFWQARQRAGLQAVMARLTGKSLDLLSFDDVRRKLRASNAVERGLREIPLDAIVGSVGRYQDFTRTFLPRHDSDESRWARVMVAQTTQGLPPISVYKVGEAYFVHDGNHRVSVARQLGNDTIQAYVTEVQTRVPLTADDQPDDLILKAEYADFLAQTHLDELRPEADLSLTEPGKYLLLLEHIEVHRYYMGLEQERSIPYKEAAAHWYDEVYLPVVRLIRQQGLLHDFPDRTEADLYLWLAEHRAEIEEDLGWQVPVAKAASDLAQQFGTYKPHYLISRVLQTVGSGREPPPSTSQWQRQPGRDTSHLFATVLVPISGQEVGWHALEQSLILAQREGSQLRGLFAVADVAQRESITVQAVQAEFKRRCQAAGIPGELVVEVGQIDRLVYDRARWADLIALRRSHTEPDSPSKLKSASRKLIRHSPVPVLVVPGDVTPLDRALLAYDGTIQSKAALFAATYLGQQWQIPLTVVGMGNKAEEATAVQDEAAQHLAEHDVQASVIPEQGETAEAILAMAVSQGTDFIIMGGSDPNPVLELVAGSTVSQVLQESAVPLLICH